MGRPRNVSSLGSSVWFYGVSEICKLGLERFWTGPKWMGTYPLFQSNNPSLMLLCALRLQHRTEVANWQPVAESDVFCPSLLYLHYLPGPPRFLSFQPLVFAVTKTVLQINDTERESALWVEWGRAQLSDLYLSPVAEETILWEILNSLEKDILKDIKPDQIY